MSVYGVQARGRGADDDDDGDDDTDNGTNSIRHNNEI